MSANLSAEIVLPWGDGKYTFALKGKQIENLEKICDAPISEIAGRIISMRAYYKEIRSVVLLGLEGGGMPPTQAIANIERFFDGRPLAQSDDEASPLATAIKVISAAWFGLEDLNESSETAPTTSTEKKSRKK